MNEYFVSLTLRSLLELTELKDELSNILEGLRRKEGIEQVKSFTVQKREAPWLRCNAQNVENHTMIYKNLIGE